MAQASVELIDALRQTARRMEEKSRENGQLAGSGVCRQVVQILIRKPAARLKSVFRKDNWQHLLSNSNAPATGVLVHLRELGLSQADLQHLERLSDPEVLARIQYAGLPQQQGRQVFAMQYLLAWAALLEEQLLATLDLPVDIGYLKLAA